MKGDSKVNDRLILLVTIGLFITIAFILWYFVLIFYLPGNVYVPEHTKKEVSFQVPVSVVQTAGEDVTLAKSPAKRKITINPGEAKQVNMKVALFGVIPAGNMSVNVVKTKQVIPGGIPVGIYMHTDGVLVLGVGSFLAQNGKTVMPAKALFEKGDYIKAVNGEKVEKKEQVISIVSTQGDTPVVFDIERKGENKQITVLPCKDVEGNYKAGIWVSDSMQGIGTLSYITEDGHFAALGHGINDNAKGELLKLGYGALYTTEIISIERGKKQDPGEITGMISLKPSNELADIDSNNEMGIYGIANKSLQACLKEDAIGICYKEEVQKGSAQILCQIDGTRTFYDAQITDLHKDRISGNKDIELAVTDPKLIGKTGGIVQGMSGSPILQNGKMVGVLTHVFVDDPTRGYGIFVEEMLNAS